jgi:hypothetical protein
MLYVRTSRLLENLDTEIRTSRLLENFDGG